MAWLIVAGRCQRRREDGGRMTACRDHDVLMLTVEMGAEGRWRGQRPGSNVSMITMEEPQWGQRWSSSSESVVSSQVPSLCGDLVDGAIWGAAAMSWRARASFSARVAPPLASRP